MLPARGSVAVGAEDKIYPVNKVLIIVDALLREGIPERRSLEGVHLSPRELRSYQSRVSLNQVLRVCGNAAKLSRDPHFAFHTGLRFHVSSFGMYGFALLSCTSHRQAISIARQYQPLSTPLGELTFDEEHGRAAWSFVAQMQSMDTPGLPRFLIELTLGTLLSVQRELLGTSFGPTEVHVPFGPDGGKALYESMLGCHVRFSCARTEFIFDSSWLDVPKDAGNVLAHQETLKLCDELMEQLRLHAGIAGQVRRFLLEHHLAPARCAAAAKHLHMTERTLRRKLLEERTSFRKLLDEMRLQLTLRYLRDTDLTIKQIAHATGFSEDASFRHALRRWGKASPRKLRDSLRVEAAAGTLERL